MSLIRRAQRATDRAYEDPADRLKREENWAEMRKAQEESSIQLQPPKWEDGSEVKIDPDTGKAGPRPGVTQRTFNPLEQIGNAIRETMDPIDKGLQELTDGVAESLLGRSREESQQLRQAGQQRNEKITDAIRTEPLGEPLRVPLGAGARAVEGILDRGAMGFDYTMQNLGINKDPARNPYDFNRYERALFDTGFAKPTTEIGQGLQKMLAFAVVMSRATAGLKGVGATGALTLGTGKLTGTGPVTKLLKTTAPSAVPGIISDVLLASDSTLSNMLRDVAPDSVKEIFFLAINDEDDQITRILKSATEGVPAGVMLDAIRMVGRGIWRARWWKKQGLPDAEAAARGLQDAEAYGKQLELDYNKGVEAESQRWAQDQSNRMRQYLEAERDITEKLQRRQELEKSVLQPEIPGLEGAGRVKVDEDFKQLGRQVELDGQVDIRDLDQIEKIRNDPRFTIEDLESGDGIRITGMSEDGWKALSEPEVRGQASESPELQKLRADLAENQRLQAELDNEIIRGYNPDSAQLEVWERNASVRPTDPNEVITGQLRTTKVGTTPKGKDAPLSRGGDGLITDAQWRLLGVDGEPLKMLKSIEQRVDLQKIAADSRMSDAEVYRRSGIILRDMMEVMNLDPGASIQQAITQAKGVKADGVLSRPGIVAMRAVLQSAAEELNQLSSLARINEAGGRINANDVDRIVDRVVGMMEMMKLAQAETGGGLRAFNLPLRQSIEGVGESFMKDANSDDMSMAAVRRWAATIRDKARSNDPKAKEMFNQLVDAMVISDGDPVAQMGFFKLATRLQGKMLMQGYYNSIFSGTTTPQAIGLSNAWTGLVRPLSLAVGGALEGDPIKVRAALSGYMGMLESLGPGLRIMKTSFKTGDSITGNARFTEQRAAKQAAIEALRKTARGDKAKELTADFLQWNNIIHDSPIMSYPGRAITAIDDLNKYVVARSEIRMTSWEEALNLSKTTGEDPKMLVQRFMEINAKKIDPTTGRILDADLASLADEASMQGDPGALVNAISNMINTFPPLKLAVPVVRSMANVQKWRMYAFPGLGTLARRITGLADKVKNGTASPYEMRMFQEYRGREVVGATVLAAGAAAFFGGRLTGRGPRDPARRAIWERENKPTRLLLGDLKNPVEIDYSRIDPLSSMLSPIADLAEASTYALSTGRMDEFAAQITYSIVASITDKAALSGLGSIADLLDPKNISDPDFAQREGLKYANNLFIPHGSLRRQISRAIDPYMREFDTALEAAVATAMPFASKLYPPKIDRMTGEPMLHESGGLWNAFSAIKVSGKNVPESTEVLNQIGYRMTDDIRLGPDGVELNAQERNFVNRKMYEWGLPKEIERLADKAWFKESLKEYMKSPKLKRIETTRFYTEVNKVHRNARQYALRELFKDTSVSDYQTRVIRARLLKQDYKRNIYNKPQEQYQNLSTFHRE